MDIRHVSTLPVCVWGWGQRAGDGELWGACGECDRRAVCGWRRGERVGIWERGLVWFRSCFCAWPEPGPRVRERVGSGGADAV